jgi:hypothetical protein
LRRRQADDDLVAQGDDLEQQDRLLTGAGHGVASLAEKRREVATQELPGDRNQAPPTDPAAM